VCHDLPDSKLWTITTLVIAPLLVQMFWITSIQHYFDMIFPLELKYEIPIIVVISILYHGIVVAHCSINSLGDPRPYSSYRDTF